ncbi:ADP-forming succinate--CoA ligase subunit beta [Pantoea sp. Nvir]|uniref:ADP-forming succinate--CoA ligase subunit beta n=1 Tax=Pantoea sp. Nvir TaxID=2576760 RepID=UPI00135C4DB4|nr:ADP-forming succinate--CoA ligase subunit beta [Pantoea sp. Nvir]MXP66325.1 ADP-forming succinate--CoA ligase subunit beta [Pantoea sp. Nvir]
MNLHEYQAKQLFVQYGMSVPKGYVCTTLREAEEAVAKIGSGPWVVKCQVYAGGRGKAGGVKVVNRKEDVCSFAESWLGKRLVTNQTNDEGQLVNKILVEAATEIEQEYYLGALVDREICRVVFIASPAGGVDIEKVVKETPDLIHKIALDPLTGPQPYQGRELAFKLGLTSKQASDFTKIFISLATMFLECDLALIEINPLVITKQGTLVCLDGKIRVDRNALFRQRKLREMHDPSQEDLREEHANQLELNYVALEGDIGCMVNGAGLAMGTMDIIKQYGGRPANFLDVGGGTTQERVSEAFKIILSDEAVKAVLVNIFGGIVRCDLIAEGIIGAVAKVGVDVPVVVRLEGNNAQLGAKKLADSGLNIIAATNLTDAAQRVVAAAKGEINKCLF